MNRHQKTMGVRFQLPRGGNWNLTPIRGFTLIEVLVALGLMALMSLMSWRGLDAMSRAQTQTQQRADEVQTLQTGLAQWTADLDTVLQVPQTVAIDWDGRALRLTRRSSTADAQGLLVVAWTRRVVDGNGQWLRWQSPPLATRAAWSEAWQRAGQWAQNPGEDEKKREISITPLEQWQIYFFRNDAWVNPFSGDAGTPGVPALGASTASASAPNMPDGVRLVLTLPAGQALGGVLTRDWVQPTQGGGRS